MPFRQPPAPLLVHDPPSSDDGSDLEDVRLSTDPALLNGSSGNFGSAGARSAPGTPQGIFTPASQTTIGGGVSSGLVIEPPFSQPCSPGCTSPSIQRSPSHSIFTKCDKASLKHLSTSTPAMTAQAHLNEPPSPKSTTTTTTTTNVSTTTKETKVHTTSKGRQKKFNRQFPSVDLSEKVLNHYSCALIGDILLQGHLYITKNYFAFYSNVFGYVTKLLIPMLSVEMITKEKTARIIPNAVGIATSDDKHVFGSLMSRDNTFRFMNKVWMAARDASLLVVDIPEPVPGSETDSSETREGESGRESPIPPRLTNVSPNIRPASSPSPLQLTTSSPMEQQQQLNETTNNLSTLTNGNKQQQQQVKANNSVDMFDVLKQGLLKFASLPRQSLILYATVLLLILLFLSAGVLLYRISKIQNRYHAYNLHDALIGARKGMGMGENSGSNGDIYSNLLQYQTQLHSKSAGAVSNFLDSNLDQLAKVRQSLEALSTLLLPTNSNNNNDDNNIRQQTTTTDKRRDFS